MPIYQGRDSCYARREGMYVKRIERPGIDTVGEAAGILYLITRDYRRGWTYDDDCGCCKIRMTHELFVKRVNYVHTLAIKHDATSKELKIIDKMIKHVLKYKKLPVKYIDLAKKMIVKKQRRRKRKR